MYTTSVSRREAASIPMLSRSTTCEEVTLAGAIEANNAVMLVAKRPTDGLVAVGLEVVDAHLFDIHPPARRVARQKAASTSELTNLGG